MPHGNVYTDDQIIAALELVHGAVYLAAERVKCDPKTIQRRAKKSKRVRDIIDKYRGRRVDVAELALDQALTRQEPWAVLFTLKMLGKDRGYVERTEVSGPDGGAVQVQVVGLGFDTDKL